MSVRQVLALVSRATSSSAIESIRKDASVRVLCLLSALMLISCSSSNSCPNMHFERLREANRAEISIDARTVGELMSQDALQHLAEFAEAHASGWSHPWYGPSVARLYVEFYAGKRFLGDLGVDRGFLSARGCGYLQSRKVDSEDRKALIGLIGIGDPNSRPRR